MSWVLYLYPVGLVGWYERRRMDFAVDFRRMSGWTSIDLPVRFLSASIAAVCQINLPTRNHTSLWIVSVPLWYSSSARLVADSGAFGQRSDELVEDRRSTLRLSAMSARLRKPHRLPCLGMIQAPTTTNSVDGQISVTFEIPGSPRGFHDFGMLA